MDYFNLLFLFAIELLKYTTNNPMMIKNIFFNTTSIFFINLRIKKIEIFYENKSIIKSRMIPSIYKIKKI